LAFNSVIASYGDYLQTEQRIIVSGKISRREGDEHATILVDTVKPVDNSNIFSIKLNDEFKFEELVFLKNKLCQFKGSDPVMLKMAEEGDETKVLTSSMFWVDTCNDLVNLLNKTFNDRITIDIKSLDSKLEEPEEVVA